MAMRSAKDAQSCCAYNQQNVTAMTWPLNAGGVGTLHTCNRAGGGPLSQGLCCVGPLLVP